NVYHSSITFTNNGNVVSKFQISVTDPAVWRSTDVAAGNDSFRLLGAFKDTEPGELEFDTALDVINTSTNTATATHLAVDADPDTIKGFNVQPGEQRALWLRIEMPSNSSTPT